MTTAQLLPMLWLSGAFLLLFLLAELLYRKARVQAEYTRKMVHAGTGLLTLIFPLALSEVWQVFALCGSFLLLLVLSMRLGWLPSINAVDRKTAGSWLYPVVVVACFVGYRWFGAQPGAGYRPLYYFYTPLLLLAFCDPVAALAGRWWKQRHPAAPPGKTLAGSAAFFALALLMSFALALGFTRHIAPLWLEASAAFAIALTTTLAERLSGGGWDNFTIPAAAMLSMWLAGLAL